MFRPRIQSRSLQGCERQVCRAHCLHALPTRGYATRPAAAASSSKPRRNASGAMSESAPGSASTGEASPASSSSSSSSSTATAAALRTAEARESALRAARLRRLAQRQDREAEEARRREEKEEYTKKYDVAARKWVSTMIALPILLVTSYYLFDRLALGNQPKSLAKHREDR